MNSSLSGWARGWSQRSWWLEKTSLITLTQSWSGGPRVYGRRVAGFKVWTNSSFTWGFSQSILWYLTILAFVSQYRLLYSIKVTTKCGTLTVIWAFLPLIPAKLWLRELTGRKAIPLPWNPIAWWDKPLADVMSPSIGSGLKLSWRFSHVHKERLSHILESQSRDTD
jgi:hypothetical protein